MATTHKLHHHLCHGISVYADSFALGADQADGFENGSAGEICDDNSLDLHGAYSGGRMETAARHGRLAAACNDHRSSTGAHGGALWNSSSRWSSSLAVGIFMSACIKMVVRSKSWIKHGSRRAFNLICVIIMTLHCHLLSWWCFIFCFTRAYGK
jgi:hypothetical protein